MVAALLRFHRLGAQSLWIDEVLTWLNAGVGHPLTLGGLLEDVHGPLFSLIVHLWTDVAGDGEWAMRLPSAVFGVATVPAMAWLATRWLGRETALPAAWLAAASPFLVWYSQEARNYSLLLLCTVLACGTLVGLARAPGPRRAIAYAAAAAGALLSNLSFVLVLPVHVFWWWENPGRPARRLVIFAALAAALALVMLPLVPQALRTWDWGRLGTVPAAPAGESPEVGDARFEPASALFALHAFAVGYTLGPTLRELRAGHDTAALAPHAPAIAAVTLVFGALGLLGLRAVARRRRLAELLLWLVLPVVLLGWMAVTHFKVFHPRYLTVCVPAFLLVLAAGLADARGWTRRVLVLAVAVLWAVSLVHHYRDPRYGKEDYRGMAAVLRARASADERIISINTDDPLKYYYRGPLRVAPVWLGFVTHPERLAQDIAAAESGAGGIWVVQSRAEDLDPSGVFARWFEANHPDAERIALEGVLIWHVRLRPQPS